jgi:acyl dehydratase
MVHTTVLTVCADLARSSPCYLRQLPDSSYGRYFEELEAGQTFRHWPGRTIAEFDDTLFSLLSMNQHPVHIDEHFATGTQHGQRLVEGPIVISLVIGMSQADIGGRATQTLEYSEVRHVGPVFHGDTIYAESTVVGKTDSGIVTVEHRGVNQREELVLTMARKIIIPRRPV